VTALFLFSSTLALLLTLVFALFFQCENEVRERKFDSD